MSNHMFAISANVHHPHMKSVYRFDDGTMSIQLGGNGYDHVSLIVTGEEWRKIVRDVDREIAKQTNPSGALYCSDCSYIGIDTADLTEHVAKNHEAEK